VFIVFCLAGFMDNQQNQDSVVKTSPNDPDAEMVQCRISEEGAKGVHRKEDVLASLILQLRRTSARLSPKEFYSLIVEKAVQLSDSEIGYLHLLEGDGKTIALTIWNQYSISRYSQSQEINALLSEATHWTECIDSKKVVFNNDCRPLASENKPSDEHYQITRYINLPLFEGGSCKLVIGVGNKSSHYNDKDFACLQVLVGEIEKYLMRQDLDNLLRSSDNLTQALSYSRSLEDAFSRVLEASLRIKDIDAGGYYEIDFETNQLALRAHQNFPKRILRAASKLSLSNSQIMDVLSGSPVYLEQKHISIEELDPQLIKSELLRCIALVPIQFNNKFIAILVLCSFSVDSFQTATRNAIQMLANQVGGALSRIQSEQRVREEQANFQNLFRTIDDLVIIFNFNGEIVMANPIVEHSLGYASTSIAGKSIFSLYQPEKIDEFSKLISQAIIQGSAVSTIPFISKTGDLFQAESRILRGKWGGRDMLFSISRDVTEREKSLEIARKFMYAVEQSPVSVVITDLGGNIEYVNPKFGEITGYSYEEIVGKSPNILKTGHTSDREYKILWETISKGREWTGEFLNRKKDGGRFWELARIAPVKDAKGRIRQYIGVKEDISERKKLEQDRREYTDYLSELNQISAVLTHSSDIKNIINKLAIHIKNIVKANCVNITIWDDERQDVTFVKTTGDHNETCFRLPEINEQTMTRFILNNGQTLVVNDILNAPFISPQVAEKFVANSPYRSFLGLPLISDERKLGAIIMGFNTLHEFSPKEIRQGEYVAAQISQAMYKIQLMEELQDHAYELETVAKISQAMRVAQTTDELVVTLLSSIKDMFKTDGTALAFYSPTKEIIFIKCANGVWQTWMGKQASVSTGITSNALFNNQIYISENLSEEENFEWRGETADIKYAICLPLTTADTLTGALWIGRSYSITSKELNILTVISNVIANAINRQILHETLSSHLRELQETKMLLMQNEKMAALGLLISGIAHEINNPLTSIFLYAHMLQRHLEDHNLRSDVENIMKEAMRVSNTVSGLLDFARVRSDKRQYVDINMIVQSALEFVDYELRLNNIEVSLVLAEDIPFTVVNLHQIQQVFINLVNNAWQAIIESKDKNKGNLQIKTELGTSQSDDNLTSGSPVVRIKFKDNGPGIKSEHLPHIFDPFFTTKPEGRGTGLGLSICQDIISKHDGHLLVESVENQGTVFIVELPIVTEDAIVAANEKVPDIVVADGARVLIIEDERNIHNVMSRVLGDRGFQVEVAENAVIALEKISNQTFQIVFCDMHIPEMDGVELYRQAKAINHDFAEHIVFMTGEITNSATQKFLGQEGFRCLIKPFDLDDLYKVIAALHKR